MMWRSSLNYVWHVSWNSSAITNRYASWTKEQCAGFRFEEAEGQLQHERVVDRTAPSKKRLVCPSELRTAALKSDGEPELRCDVAEDCRGVVASMHSRNCVADTQFLAPCRSSPCLLWSDAVALPLPGPTIAYPVNSDRPPTRVRQLGRERVTGVPRRRARRPPSSCCEIGWAATCTRNYSRECWESSMAYAGDKKPKRTEFAAQSYLPNTPCIFGRSTPRKRNSSPRK